QAAAEDTRSAVGTAGDDALAAGYSAGEDETRRLVAETPAGYAVDAVDAARSLRGTRQTARRGGAPPSVAAKQPATAAPHSRAGRRPSVPFEQTTRYFRGRIVATLRELHRGETVALAELGPRVKPDYTVADEPWLHGLVAGLARD